MIDEIVPSEAAKKLACELANAQYSHEQFTKYEVGGSCLSGKVLLALALRLDFEDKVARELRDRLAIVPGSKLEKLTCSLMLPDEPDPLREVLAAAIENSRSGEKLYEVLRAELAKRGGKIVWEDPK